MKAFFSIYRISRLGELTAGKGEESQLEVVHSSLG